MNKTIELAQSLIACASLTPLDAGCQALLIAELQRLNFTIERLKFGEVDNFWATHGHGHPVMVFAGHTDVVPTGPLADWRFPPFKPTISEGYLYGRGAADMKGSLSAMVVAAQQFLHQHPHHRGTLAFLVTSDEEGPAVDGTAKVVDYLQAQGKSMDWCVIGEPASVNQVGDAIKIGRRGSLGGKIHIRGIQGHIAYPHLSRNPIHEFAPALEELCQIEWDQGNEFFPPTTFQFSNIHAGTGATNVIPGHLEADFNLRYSTAITQEHIKATLQATLKKYPLQFDIQWLDSGNPFLTKKGELIIAAQQAIREVMEKEPELSTTGGTSDGRFIAPLGVQVVEIGPLNKTIHKVDECVGVDELLQLTRIYQRMLELLLI